MSGKEFIKNLKIGDKVIVDSSRFGGEHLAVRKVVKITPKHNIKLDNGELHRNGQCRIDAYCSNYLMEWTQKLDDKIRDKYIRNVRLNTIRKTNWTEVSDSKIGKIFYILEE